MPERTPLNATKTGELAVDGCVIETAALSVRAGLYVTANLYRPTKVEGRLPAILYVCGHSDAESG
jgi:hypothetical protein